ncbi:MAG: peptidase M15 [Deltaproteobacteria bacterium]|nr:peptidase M15 [Deltaproteobacteria bacterium]
MNLSKNFTLNELTHTDTGLTNEPDDAQKEKLLYLATYVLQPIRDRWGGIKVTSGYRSTAVNAAIGSTPHSQHLFGEAADFVPLVAGVSVSQKLDSIFAWLVSESGIPFGQCIRETSGSRQWIHVSLPRLNAANQDALVYDGKDYKSYL